MAVAILLVATAIIVYLGINDPESAPAPRCLFNALTGYDCPGCGSQRAIHALLHGRVGEAWGYNAALFFAVPLIAVYAVAPRRWHRTIYAPWFTLGIGLAILLWWVLRNV